MAEKFPFDYDGFGWDLAQGSTSAYVFNPPYEHVSFVVHQPYPNPPLAIWMWKTIIDEENGEGSFETLVDKLCAPERLGGLACDLHLEDDPGNFYIRLYTEMLEERMEE